MTKNEVNDNLKAQYNAVDIFKFICALLVCTIHLAPFSSHILKNANGVNFYIVNCLSRIAVPFFFTTAGFFLYKKANIEKPDTNIIKDYCFKLLRLIGIWWVLLFMGEKNHLWYLGSLVISILLITLLLNKKIKIKYIIIITLLLYIIGLLGDSYYDITRMFKNSPILNNIITNYETYFKTTRNGIFFSPIFVAIGALIASNKVKINLKLSYFGAIISFYLLVTEVFILSHYFHPKDYNMFISLVPLMFFTLNTLINIKLKCLNSKYII